MYTHSCIHNICAHMYYYYKSKTITKWIIQYINPLWKKKPKQTILKYIYFKNLGIIISNSIHLPTQNPNTVTLRITSFHGCYMVIFFFFKSLYSIQVEPHFDCYTFWLSTWLWSFIIHLLIFSSNIFYYSTLCNWDLAYRSNNWLYFSLFLSFKWWLFVRNYQIIHQM